MRALLQASHRLQAIVDEPPVTSVTGGKPPIAGAIVGQPLIALAISEVGGRGSSRCWRNGGGAILWVTVGWLATDCGQSVTSHRLWPIGGLGHWGARGRIDLPPIASNRWVAQLGSAVPGAWQAQTEMKPAVHGLQKRWAG
jgi:hypothetical protein